MSKADSSKWGILVLLTFLNREIKEQKRNSTGNQITEWNNKQDFLKDPCMCNNGSNTKTHTWYSQIAVHGEQLKSPWITHSKLNQA